MTDPGLAEKWRPYAIATRRPCCEWRRIEGRPHPTWAVNRCLGGYGAVVTLREPGGERGVAETLCYRPFRQRQQPVLGYAESVGEAS